MSLYRDYILDHYKNPRNKGGIEGFTHYSGKVNNPLCGDEMEVWVSVVNQVGGTETQKLKTENLVHNIGFDGHGCAICIASASLITEWVKGKTFQEIERLTPEAVTELLGIPLTPIRLKCALLSRDALCKALKFGTLS